MLGDFDMLFSKHSQRAAERRHCRIDDDISGHGIIHWHRVDPLNGMFSNLSVSRVEFAIVLSGPFSCWELPKPESYERQVRSTRGTDRVVRYGVETAGLQQNCELGVDGGRRNETSNFR